jgi:hypothetical protein
MKDGICALCGKAGKLHESHFLPKGLYRLLRGSNNGNDNPVLMSARVSVQQAYQMKQPLLCSACERRFSEKGETYVLPLLNQRNTFPLLDRLKLALPLYATGENTAFKCQSVGLDGEKIAYFGLSILWRAAVTPWRTFDHATTSVTLDAPYLESIRRYLVGETGWPSDVSVIATIAMDFVSQNICFVPNRITDNPFHIAYGLLAKGLYYRFILGGPSPIMKEISCAGPGMNLIFVRDCTENSWPAVEEMMRTTVPKGGLAET